jgi:hypothetical protein
MHLGFYCRLAFTKSVRVRIDEAAADGEPAGGMAGGGLGAERVRRERWEMVGAVMERTYVLVFVKKLPDS